MTADSAEMPLPDTFIQRLADVLAPEAFDQVVRTFEQPKSVGFRINQLKRDVVSSHDALRAMDLCWYELPWYWAGGYVAPGDRERLLAWDLISAGEVYVQNPSSMLVALALGAQPGEQILDLAAAPGGKSILLAECMSNRGYLAAVEPIRGRYYQLRHQLELAGVRIARTFLSDGRRIGGKTPDRFDRVLLDAPCSGEARFRACDGTTWHYWSLRKIREQSRKQRGLLISALRALRPGGTLVYSTCSFAPEENEAVIDFALRRSNASAQLVPLTLPISNVMPGLTRWQNHTYHESLVQAIRILPTNLYDGFFLARLTKTEPSGRQNPRTCRVR